MTDSDINQPSIISIYFFQNTTTEILSVCTLCVWMQRQGPWQNVFLWRVDNENGLIYHDVQEIQESELNLGHTQILFFLIF